MAELPLQRRPQPTSNLAQVLGEGAQALGRGVGAVGRAIEAPGNAYMRGVVGALGWDPKEYQETVNHPLVQAERTLTSVATLPTAVPLSTAVAAGKFADPAKIERAMQLIPELALRGKDALAKKLQAGISGILRRIDLDSFRSRLGAADLGPERSERLMQQYLAAHPAGWQQFQSRVPELSNVTDPARSRELMDIARNHLNALHGNTPAGQVAAAEDWARLLRGDPMPPRPPAGGQDLMSRLNIPESTGTEDLIQRFRALEAPGLSGRARAGEYLPDMAPGASLPRNVRSGTPMSEIDEEELHMSSEDIDGILNEAEEFLAGMRNRRNR